MTRLIAFLIFPDFQLLDAAGPLGAFEMPTRGVTPAPYVLKVIARTPGLVTSSSGAIMLAEGLGDPAAIDTLVVAGGQGTEAAATDRETRHFIREVAKTARRVTSVCSGAYILAAAGLLDGKRATTHWGRSRHFPTLFPEVKLEPDRIWVRDGQIWTSAGVTAGIDLSLALIAEDLGEAVARRAAQELVVYHRRPGGQSQFSALLEIERPGGRFAGLLAWARERVAEPLSVERLADEAGMSPRNFARAFLAETGVTPAKAVERLRLEVAREQVEDGCTSIEAVARSCGFNDPERMRRAFLRAFGQPPQAMRRGAKAA
jgi:transcriptional regulator GlxA family with amidase domain